MKKLKYLLMAALVLPCAVFTACGDDDDDDKINVEKPETPILTNTSVEQYIDNSYTPTTSDLQNVWEGNYEGWDEKQQKNTKIKRMLTLSPNGNYENVIEGILVESGKDKYTKFEHEKGTYSYNSSTKAITYTVTVDSLLDYGKQKMDAYKGKKFLDHTDARYTETANFSQKKDNQRSWITRDTYLQSLTTKQVDISFAMVVQVKNK